MTAHLEELLRHDTAGGPCSGLRWVRRTTRKLADYLTKGLNLPVAPGTVARLLRKMGHRLPADVSRWRRAGGRDSRRTQR